MKQKNLILMVVAVGCGLVAAFLTSQMSAKPGQGRAGRGPRGRQGPAGRHHAHQGRARRRCVKYKKFAKDGLPAAVVATEDELVDKRLARTIRAERDVQPGRT